MPAPHPLLPDVTEPCIGQHGRRLEQHHAACFTLFQTLASIRRMEQLRMACSTLFHLLAQARQMEQQRPTCSTLFQTPAARPRRQAFTMRSSKPSMARMALRVSTTSGQWAARL